MDIGKKKVSFPMVANYNSVVRYFVECGLDAQFIMPPKMTRRTLEIGSRYSPDYVCAPFKSTLGSMIDALEAGAEDLSNEGEVFEITTEVSTLGEVREALEQAGYKLDSAEISRIPQNTVAPDAAFYENIEKLLDMLEENDDIQNVYHNAEMDA